MLGKTLRGKFVKDHKPLDSRQQDENLKLRRLLTFSGINNLHQGIITSQVVLLFQMAAHITGSLHCRAAATNRTSAIKQYLCSAFLCDFLLFTRAMLALA